MPKSLYVNFHEGSRFRGMGSEGEVRLLQNARVEGRSILSLRYPQYLNETIPADTVQTFVYRGRRINSSTYRDYTTEYTGGAERICYTQYGDWPMKQINGNELPLGILRPTMPPVVAEDGALILAAPSVSGLADGSGVFMKTSRVSVRVAVKTNLGVLPPSGRTIIVPANDNSAVQIEWTRPTMNGMVIVGFLVFAGDPDDERLVSELPVGSTTFTYDGRSGGYPDKAKSYDQTVPYQYFYTFLQNCEGVEAESGPSPISPPAVRFTGRKIAMPTETDGYWDQPNVEIQSGVVAATVADLATSPIDLSYTITKPVMDDDRGMYKVSIAGHKLKKGDWCLLRGGKTVSVSAFADSVMTVPSGHGFTAFSWVNILAATGAGTWVGKTVLVTAVTDTSITLDIPNQTGWTAISICRTAVVEVITTIDNDVYLDVDAFMDATAWGTTTLKRQGSCPVLWWEWNAYHGGMVIHTTKLSSLDTNATMDGDVACLGPDEKITIKLESDPVYNGTIEMECVRLSDDPGAYLVLDQAQPKSAPEAGVALSDSMLYRSEWTIEFASALPSFPEHGDLVKVDFPTYSISSIVGVNGNTLFMRRPGSIAATDQTVTLTWVPKNNFIKARRVYRVGDTTEFLMVEDVPLDAPFFLDYRSVEYLGEVCTSYNLVNGIPYVDDAAPETLESIEKHYDMLFAIDGEDVCWTDAGRPDAWSKLHRERFPSKPIALASTRQTLAVLCLDGVMCLDGNSPYGMSKRTTNAVEGCLAAGSVQKTNKGVIYLSKRGLNLFDGHNSVCFTDERFDLKQMFGTAPDESLWGVPWLGSVDTKAFVDALYVDRGTVKHMDWVGTLPAIFRGFRSFMYRGHYYIYNVAPAYAGMGMWVVDTDDPKLPVQHIGISPSDVFVDEYQTISMLFGASNRPVA